MEALANLRELSSGRALPAIQGELDEILGKPYEKGAVGPDAFDCYGIAAWLFQRVFGVELPAVASGQDAEGIFKARKAFRVLDELEKFQPLDLFYWEQEEPLVVAYLDGHLYAASMPSVGVCRLGARFVSGKVEKVYRFQG